MSASSGAHTIWVYRWEDDGEFNQAPGDPTDSTDKVFGANETMDSADRANNPERMFRPFSRAAEEIIETNFEGSWSADFVLANTWWLQFFFGAPTTSSVNDDGSAPWEHTYDTDPSVGGSPKSAHLIEETHHPDGSIEQTVYTGVVAGSIDMDVSTEDTVSVSLDGNYADEQTYDDNVSAESPYGVIGSQPDLSYRPMHFGNSILKLDIDDDGTAESLALVQEAGLGLEGNVEMSYELGTRFPVIPQYLNYEPDIDYTRLVSGNTSPDEKTANYGASYGSSTASPQETLTDAAIDGSLEFNANTSTTNKLVMNIIGAFPDEYSRSNIGDPGEALEDDITRMIEDVTATVESDQETPA